MNKPVKIVTKFVCQGCGAWHGKWSGKCESCGEWNLLVEEQTTEKRVKSIQASQASGNARYGKGGSLEFLTISDPLQEYPRHMTHISEFDRVCGGGMVPGSVLLVGGDPGIGKSTLLLQVVARLSEQMPCAYISGEEGVTQIMMRGQRLNLQQNTQLHLAASTNVQEMIEGLGRIPGLQLVIIDSIQTMASEYIESAPGTVSQVRACSHELIASAKKNDWIVILVGHVTKEGTLAGPRVLEHMVDTVLYFEGERGDHYRILRSVKNRFGATDEIGVFEMTDCGLQEVTNPSALFLGDHSSPVSGSAIFAGIEGTRPILSEIQALVAPSYLASPRRTCVGWDTGRLAMILAVLEARCGLTFGNKDVYLNVAGGLKITDPAADLAVAAALVSALTNAPCPPRSVFFGEIGLSGEIRSVSQTDSRLKESSKLGFEQAFCVLKSDAKGKNTASLMKGCTSLKYLLELLEVFPRPVRNEERRD